MEQAKPKSKVKVKYIVLPIVAFLLLCIMIAANIVFTMNAKIIHTYFSGNDDGKKSSVVTSADTIVELGDSLVQEIGADSMVLLRNENNALPLKTEERNITVFGKNSADIVLGGTGSNAGSSGGEKTDFSVVLESDGRFRTNPVMRSYLSGNASGTGRPNAPGMGVTLSGFPTGEAPLPYPDDVKASYNDYNDAAIVVISRIGGEGFDLPRTMRYTGSKYTDFAAANQVIPGARSGDDHYLQLDRNETDMLDEACRNFEKVIVVINSAAPTEHNAIEVLQPLEPNLGIRCFPKQGTKATDCRLFAFGREVGKASPKVITELFNAPPLPARHKVT